MLGRIRQVAIRTFSSANSRRSESSNEGLCYIPLYVLLVSRLSLALKKQVSVIRQLFIPLVEVNQAI